MTRCNFDYDGLSLNELSFKKGEIFHIRDTMYNGVIGSWQAQRVDCRGIEKDHGIIPNQARYKHYGRYKLHFLLLVLNALLLF